ncbi:glycoside hydrolase family 2 protein [Paramicrobacterium agarici]|uniref:glycoside hydrolase family 2 protein n=1 Tax=Paramicrobacterium agarici TaxID=630514 RepID=UPI001153A995|nr:glycoside hydrolase family 2 TIM barrel-domain containing protein [Microbacterium agarici]TQO22998.1 glycosyl hydrolase family 2 [Microbacterium agarici]
MSLSSPQTVVPDQTVESTIPRSEYPRPDRDRSARWLTLNGQWDFSADGIAAPITVPFAWESEASGIHRTWLERGEYRRSIVVPEEWAGSSIVVSFGAVHHRATVSLDGSLVGEHVGGYESFEFDITSFITPGVAAEISVVVDAPADKRAIPHGKQRSIPRDDYDGVSFTPTSGIWQSVWLEARGTTYAEGVELRGDSLNGIDVAVTLSSPRGARVTAQVEGSESAVTLDADANGCYRGRIDLQHPRLWSPEQPHLYRVEVSVDDGQGYPDAVVATTGLRRIETRGEQLLLNGRRFSMRGVLDQGYWADTGLTAPSADALRRDIHLARELGYNLVRKHLKFEDPLWLHEADVTGTLVWAEPACPSRFSDEAAGAFEAQLPAMVERDGNHPSIVIWGLYNEEWGLDWDIPHSPARAEAAARAYDRLRELDATRPIVENSGWSHVKSDLVDWHYYEPDLATWKQAMADMVAGTRETFPVRLAPDFVVDKSLYGSADFPRQGVPIVNSEYGEGFTSLERAWHLRWETQEMRRHDRFAGYIYTEFADVEHEGAGLLAEDRRAKDWGGCIPADVNAETVLILDLVPLRAGADIEPPAEEFALDVRVSHHGGADVSGVIHAAWLPFGTPVAPVPAAQVVSHALTVAPFEVSDAVSLTVPPVAGPARLLLWFADESGAVLARSFLDAAEVEPPNRRGARPGEFVGVAQPGVPN